MRAGNGCRREPDVAMRAKGECRWTVCHACQRGVLAKGVGVTGSMPGTSLECKAGLCKLTWAGLFFSRPLALFDHAVLRAGGPGISSRGADQAALRSLQDQLNKALSDVK